MSLPALITLHLSPYNTWVHIHSKYHLKCPNGKTKYMHIFHKQYENKSLDTLFIKAYMTPWTMAWLDSGHSFNSHIHTPIDEKSKGSAEV